MISGELDEVEGVEIVDPRSINGRRWIEGDDVEMLPRCREKITSIVNDSTSPWVSEDFRGIWVEVRERIKHISHQFDHSDIASVA